MTTEELSVMSDYSDLRKAAESAPALNFKECQVFREPDNGDYVECPHCDGGTVDAGNDYCNFDGAAIGVQFYGIGTEHVAAEQYLDAAKPSVIIGMIDEIETLRAKVAELEAGSEVIGKIEGYEVDSVYARVRICGMELPEVGTPLYTTPQPAKVPKGYALVPIEPSEAMRKAFWRAHDRYEDGIGEMPDSGWRAMLSAQNN